MRAATGQALRWCQRVIRLAVALALLGGGILAWRLAQGPLAAPMLAREIERAANGGGGLRLEVGEAAVAWEGWRSGSAAPLDIRLDGVRLRDAAGTLRADLPEVAVTLSMRALLQGRLAPASIELRRPSLLVTREADGSVSLGAGMALPAAEEADAAAAPGGTPIAALVRALRGEGPPALAAFRRLRIQDGHVLVLDQVSHRRWSLARTSIELRRNAAGALSAEGGATAEGLGLSVPVRFGAAVPPGEAPPLTAELVLPALRPAELATLWPDLAPLRLLDAAVTLGATARFDTAGMPQRVEARLLGGPGALDFGAGRRLPFTGFGASLEGSERALRLTAATLRLPGQGPGHGPGNPGPELHATGQARRVAEGWAAEIAVSLAALDFATLPALWPEGLAEAARGPALAALAGGRLRDLGLRASGSAGAELADLRLEEARLGFAVEHPVLALGAAVERAMPGALAPGAALGNSLAPGTRLVAERLEFAARATPDLLRLDRLALRLAAPGADTPATTLLVEGEARRPEAEAGWTGHAALGLDRLRFADLARLWPEGLRPNERAWITENVTAGTLHDGRWRLEAAMPAGPGSLALTGFTGTAEATDATVYWLRPVPPVQGVAGTATFSTTEIVLRARGGRQVVEAAAPRAARPTGRRGQAATQQAAGRAGTLEAREAVVRFLDLDASPGRSEIEVQLGGALPEVLTLLRHPRLKLFEKKPLELGATAGQAEARLTIGFPLLADLPFEAVRLRAVGRVSEARLTDVLLGHELDRAAVELTVDTDGLKASGQGVMVDAPLRLSLEMDFRAGAQSQVTERAQVSVARADARQLGEFGLDTMGLMEGTAAVEARYERRRSGQGSVALRGDLREARLALDPLGWAKPLGQAGSAEATLRLSGDQLTAAEGLRLEAEGLALSGRIGFQPGNRLDRVEIAPGSRLGQSSFGGTVTRPAREGGPWSITLRGPLLDLQPIFGATEDPAARSAPPPPPPGRGGPRYALDARFDRATTGPGRDLLGLGLRAEVDAQGLLRQGQVTGSTGPGQGFELAVTPQGAVRHMRLSAQDGGALLRALDLTDSIAGGRLSVTAHYAELRPGAPLSGTAELEGFAVRNAPGFGKLLQAMTLYGLVEAVQGGNGLVFTRLVAPFTLSREALALDDARAFSASLGLTAKGHVWRERGVVDIQGTLVPAYFFNQLLGHIPLVGRLFSPERGGGVFAATYRVQGPRADPAVSVNPLAALTPGFLRGVFGLAEGSGRGTPVPNPTDR